jgi:hypothetical protein
MKNNWYSLTREVMIDYMYSVNPNPFVIEFQTWWIHACGVEISFLLSWLVEVLLLQQEIGVTIDLVVHRYFENVLETS